jgi:hypothetical protein
LDFAISRRQSLKHIGQEFETGWKESFQSLQLPARASELTSLHSHSKSTTNRGSHELAPNDAEAIAPAVNTIYSKLEVKTISFIARAVPYTCE